MLERVGIANQTTMLKGDTEQIGKMFEKTMMQKYGPESLSQHFMVMDTICDATQVRAALCACTCRPQAACPGMSGGLPALPRCVMMAPVQVALQCVAWRGIALQLVTHSLRAARRPRSCIHVMKLAAPRATKALHMRTQHAGHARRGCRSGKMRCTPSQMAATPST